MNKSYLKKKKKKAMKDINHINIEKLRKLNQITKTKSIKYTHTKKEFIQEIMIIKYSY